VREALGILQAEQAGSALYPQPRQHGTCHVGGLQLVQNDCEYCVQLTDFFPDSLGLWPCRLQIKCTQLCLSHNKAQALVGQYVSIVLWPYQNMEGVQQAQGEAS
jgi:hypothetical protein